MSVIIDGTLGISAVAPGVVDASDLVQDTGPWGFKNKLINGNFDLWQRGTAGAAGYVADRWYGGSDGNINITQSRQTFTIGQTEVPGNPTYFHRTVTTAATTGGMLRQPVEDVRTLSGKVIVSFYAKASAGITLDYVGTLQSFGSGGSPSVTTAGAINPTITTAWQKYSVTINVPSIAGKTITADSSISIVFRIPDNIAVSLDIARVQLEEGSVATPFEQRPYGLELALCQRYYESLTVFIPAAVPVPVRYSMRVAPTVSGNGTASIFNNTTTMLSIQESSGQARTLILSAEI